METVNLNNSRVQAFNAKQSGAFFTSVNKVFNKMAQNFENTRFGMMAMYMIIQSCVAAIAAMYILQNDASVFLLGASAALAMGSNAVFIAQGSAKLCLAVFYMSMIANVAIIIFNV